MPRRFFKRIAPHPDKIKTSKSLGWLGETLHHPGLWRFNRHCIAGAFAVGLFCMWVPFPTQTLLAAVTAVFLRVNLPLSVVLVYITNPFTIPPMFYGAYCLGAVILGVQIQDIGFELSYEWLHHTLGLIWQPLLLGCFITGIISALLGYYGVHLFWRMHIVQRWEARRQKRKKP